MAKDLVRALGPQIAGGVPHLLRRLIRRFCGIEASAAVTKGAACRPAGGCGSAGIMA